MIRIHRNNITYILTETYNEYVYWQRRQNANTRNEHEESTEKHIQYQPTNIEMK